VKFHLIDRIQSVEPGSRIVGIKSLSLAEEYLADHFPAFPVLPGVLMLESLVQTAAWLLRVEQDWSRSLIQLSSVRNVRYGNFVAPGETLRTDVELIKVDGDLATVKGVGTVGDGQQAVQGRLVIRSLNVADICPAAADADQRIIAQLKQRFRLIGGPEALAAAGAA
jgi:3-hydroxyacyl-[acyl-carrier-protein] dehydratase